MSAHKLTASERALRTSCNAGVKAPAFLASITESDVIECDICHRTILYIHFHTVATTSKIRMGVGLDFCNVCRVRYEQAASNTRKGTASVGLLSVNEKGVKTTMRMAIGLRFFFASIRSENTSVKNKVMAGTSTAFLRKMYSQEQTPESVPESELFECVAALRVVSQGDVGGSSIKAVEKPNTAKTERSAATVDNEADVEVDHPRAESGPVSKKIRHEEPQRHEVDAVVNAELLVVSHLPVLSDEICKELDTVSTSLNMVREESGEVATDVILCDVDESIPILTERDLSDVGGGSVTDFVEEPSQAFSTMKAPSDSSPVRSPVVDHKKQDTTDNSVFSEACQTTCKSHSVRSATPGQRVDDAHDVAFIEAAATSPPEVMPPAFEPSTPRVSFAKGPRLAIPHPTPIPQPLSLESGAVVGNDSASGDSDNEPNTIEASRELLALFDLLPNGYGVDNVVTPSFTATRFTLFTDNEDLATDDVTDKNEDGVEVTCHAGAAQLIGSDQTVLGVRTSGTLADACWVPVPPHLALTEALFCTLTLSDQTSIMTLWRTGLTEGDEGSFKFKEASACYTVVTGRQAIVGSMWLPIPALYSEACNRVGAFSVVREKAVCTFILPIRAEAEDGDYTVEVGAVPNIRVPVAGMVVTQEPIVSALWAPRISSLTELRLCIQCRSGSVTIYQHLREDDATIAHVVSSCDRMRMARVITLSGVSPSPPLRSLHMAAGFIHGIFHLSWSCGADLCVARAPFDELSVLLKKTVGDGNLAYITAIAPVDAGVVFSVGKSGVRLMRLNGKEKLLSESLGVTINSITPTNAYQSKRLYMSTATNQFFHMRRTSMTTHRSIMEFVCTPHSIGGSLSNEGYSVTTNAGLRKRFGLFHINDAATNRNNLLSLISSKGGSPLEASDVRWRVRKVVGWFGVTRTPPTLSLGMCPDGSIVLFVCPI